MMVPATVADLETLATVALAPCPFCGGENVRLTCSGGTWEVTCGSFQEQGCGGRSGLAESAESAARKWNSRLLARAEAMERDVAALRQELAAVRKGTEAFALNREESAAVGYLLESVLRGVKVSRDRIPATAWTTLDNLFQRMLDDAATSMPAEEEAW